MRATFDPASFALRRPVTTPRSSITTSTGSSSSSTPTTSFQDVLQQTTQPAQSTSNSQVTGTPSTPSTQDGPTSPSLNSIASMANGGLMVNPTGRNALTGGTIAYNPNFYATLDAATQVAQMVGGTVVDRSGQFSNNQSEYYVTLPNGTEINAGNLVAILNNPVYQQNSRVMDGKIAELLNNNAIGSTNPGIGRYTVTNGQVAYDPTGYNT